MKATPQLTRYVIGAAIVVATIIGLIWLGPRQINPLKHETNRVIDELGRRFDAKPYVLSSKTECIESGGRPTVIGKTLSVKYCYFVTVVAYYPRITVSDYVQQPEGLQSVSYIHSDAGKTLEETVSAMGLDGSKRPEVVPLPSLHDRLKMASADTLTISGVGARYRDPAPERIDGVWTWDSSLDRTRGIMMELKTDIDKKVLAGEKLIPGGLSSGEALRDGRAPLVMYVTDRFCHSPYMLGLSQLCVLPN